MLRWLKERFAIDSLLASQMSKRVPPNVGWLHTLGAAALTIFLVQLVTGFALALHYVPSPDHAHNAIAWMMEHIPAGRFVRSLHVYGASAMVIAVTLHFWRVYFTSAYRPPREGTWWLGLALLGLVLAFGFTGYLLPWDQKAYWATVVGTQIASTTPVIDAQLHQLMVGGDHLGALTLTRFFALHVLLLPALTLGLIGLHLFLVDHHGIRGKADTNEEKTGPGSKPFFPHHVFKESITAAVAVLILVVLANVAPAELGPVADPSDKAFIPRPEWYFLPLFQLLKYFPGRLEVLATIGVPGLAAVYLLLLPWIDNGLSAARAKLVKGIGVVSLGAIIALLTLGAMDRPAEPPSLTPSPSPVLADSERRGEPEADGAAVPSDNAAAQPPDWLNESNAKVGKLLYGVYACDACHAIGGKGESAGPALDGVALRKPDLQWQMDHLRDPAALVPGSIMPKFTGSDEELRQVVAYLMGLTEGPVTQGP